MSKRAHAQEGSAVQIARTTTQNSAGIISVIGFYKLLINVLEERPRRLFRLVNLNRTYFYFIAATPSFRKCLFKKC